ncbi:hypothetical protein SAMN02745687_01024 [Lachnospiraceae bacterium NK3A20]|nr:hypothetical protein SAMN02745687_01024 [Lachnospiraceae bacterium NK3A20]
MALSECKAVDSLIRRVQDTMAAEGVPGGDFFEKAFRDTLDRTIKAEPDGTTFIITGDIPAMWLRDSTCQMRPYLTIAKEAPEIAAAIEGLIRRQIQCVLIDPYANAFNETANGNCWAHDKTDMKPELWERKYEIDSLCYAMQLPYLYWKNTGRTAQFTKEFMQAAKTVVQVFRTEQDHENLSPYRFERGNTFFTDNLSREGKGALVRSNIGLIWSGFRPSDDACVYGYLIPANMFASVILGYLAEIAEEIYHDEAFSRECADFSMEVRTAVEKYGSLTNYYLKKDYYAYEVDGFGQYLIMDDANLPSLLSMPYYGYCDQDDPKYQETKKLILSDANPYYYEGQYLRGIGSIHTPARYVWHLAVAMQGLVADTREEKAEKIRMIMDTDGGTKCVHEGVLVDDPTRYTREWFSWGNAIFCELCMDYCGIRVRMN